MSLQDPHYKAILEGLASSGLDAAKFEHFASDVLRDEWPNLVCMPGGNDRGQDGAAVTREGDPVRLVCTTSRDVIGNLTGSLGQMDPEITRVILATSQSLTHAQRRNVEQRARERGRTLLQIYAGEAFADRLFANSRWSRELLGIDGRPAALSALPRSARPLFDLPPIGRDEDLAWLAQTPGDRILVGQPGSGKTHLLRRLTQDPDSRAFFAVDKDPMALANAVRDLQPRIVIVDDAFEDPAFLRALRQLRGSSGFSIVAATWPYRLEEVRAELGEVAEDHVRRLEGLTRRELMKLFRAAGVEALEEILVELVRQARNKPGLAATLILSWRATDYRRIASGEALMTSLAPALRQIAGSEHPALLGVLALGGRHGVHLERAAPFLGMPIETAHRITADLAASGILEVRASGALVVVPEELGSALLGRAFLGQVSVPGWQQFAESLGDKASVLDALLGAAESGSTLDRDLLLRWIREFGWRASRQRFASLSEQYADLAREAFPDHFLELAPSLLVWKPRETIRQLLQISLPDRPEEPDIVDYISSEEPTPLEVIGKWLTEGHPVHQLAASLSTERKLLFLEEIERFLRRGGDRNVGAQALLLVSSSSLRHSDQTLDGMRLVTTLLPAEPQILIRAWEILLGTSSDLGDGFWKYCQYLVDGFAGTYCRASTKKVRESWQAAAQRILSDLGGRVPPRSVEASKLKAAGGYLEIPVDAETDPVLDSLLDRHVLFSDSVRCIVEVSELLDSGEQADLLLRYSTLVGEGQNPGGRIATAARQLAETAADPLVWLETWVAGGVPGSWLGPLLENVASRRPAGWDQRLSAFLDHDDYAAPAAIALLGHGDLPAILQEAALRVLRRHPHETFRLAQAPVIVVRRLLLEDGPISQWALENEWFRQGSPRSELIAELEDAANRAPFDGAEDVLEQIWGQRPDLLEKWLRRYVASPEGGPADFSSNSLELISSLAETVRLEVLQALRPNRADEALVRALVGTSPEIYRALLERSDGLAEFAPDVLAFLPDPEWAKLAEVALEETELGEHGIVLTAFEAVAVFDPRDSEVWLPFLGAFEKLATDRPGLARLAARGIAEAKRRIGEAQERQRRFELTGSPFATR